MDHGQSRRSARARDFQEIRASWASSTHCAPLFAPSLLSADFSRLHEEAARAQAAGARWLHVDVMDGHFVPNLTMGPAVVASLARTESLPLDCHLMVTKPELLSEPFARAGADIITLHIETLRNPAAQLADLKRLGVEVGLTLRPSTPLSAIEPYLSDVDLVLVMTVEPGFSGQTFMQEPANRVRWLRQTRQERSLRFVIEVDGGVGPQTVEQVAWADVLVCGNALFRVPDIKLAMDEMRQRALAARRRDLS